MGISSMTTTSMDEGSGFMKRREDLLPDIGLIPGPDHDPSQGDPHPEAAVVVERKRSLSHARGQGAVVEAGRKRSIVPGVAARDRSLGRSLDQDLNHHVILRDLQADPRDLQAVIAARKRIQKNKKQGNYHWLTVKHSLYQKIFIQSCFR